MSVSVRLLVHPELLHLLLGVPESHGLVVGCPTLLLAHLLLGVLLLGSLPNLLRVSLLLLGVLLLRALPCLLRVGLLLLGVSLLLLGVLLLFPFPVALVTAALLVLFHVVPVVSI